MNSSPFVWGCARTPFGSLGGALAELSPLELALTASRGAVADAGISPERIGAIVAAVGLPTGADDLALAAALGKELGVENGVPTTTLVGLDAALEALSSGVFLAGMGGMSPTLVVAADSASRAAYWVPGLRVGASTGSANVIDPLGAASDPLSRDESPAQLLEAAAANRGISRAEQDEYSAGSHPRAISRNGSETDPVVPQPLPGAGALDADELVRADASAAALGETPPIFSREGTLTARNTARPIDGAAALVLGLEGRTGPRIGMPVRRASEAGSSGAVSAAQSALQAAGLTPSDLDFVSLGECSAAQALVAIADLKLDPERVNRGGGQLASGRPISGGAIALAVESTAVLSSTGGATGLLADEGAAGTGIAVVLRDGPCR